MHRGEKIVALSSNGAGKLVRFCTLMGFSSRKGLHPFPWMKTFL
ncbi:hypothetical protein DOT_4118 [Desulfosporosinus sp. OT]|nr:hypothetical protein DOT_4118 [Desulfosporosinus sp. OT]